MPPTTKPLDRVPPHVVSRMRRRQADEPEHDEEDDTDHALPSPPPIPAGVSPELAAFIGHSQWQTSVQSQVVRDGFTSLRRDLRDGLAAIRSERADEAAADRDGRSKLWKAVTSATAELWKTFRIPLGGLVTYYVWQKTGMPPTPSPVQVEATVAPAAP